VRVYYLHEILRVFRRRLFILKYHAVNPFKNFFLNNENRTMGQNIPERLI
jgi:hypothetical protein